MGFGSPGFVVAIVLIAAVGWVLTSWIRARHGYPLSDDWGNPVHPSGGPDAERQVELLSRENEKLRLELADQSLRDRATGLYTRPHFEDQLRREVDLSTREHREFALVLIEMHREDIESLPRLLQLLAPCGRRCLIFCDDLSFDAGESSYKSLKAVLEGGIEGRPDNVLFYATSNRRHLMPRQMIENERGTAIHPGEAVEEKVSLSDRFSLWLGFHPCSQDVYLAMIDGYVRHYGLELPAEQLRTEALEWAATRGARSGRVAWQFINDLAGRLGTNLSA